MTSLLHYALLLVALCGDVFCTPITTLSISDSSSPPSANVSGLQPLSGGVELNKCQFPPSGSILISYTLSSSLWSTEIRGYVTDMHILCLTIYDAGGPFGTVLDYFPYWRLSPGKVESLLIYHKYEGYDGWIMLELPKLKPAVPELYMKIGGTFVQWIDKQGLDLVFFGGSSSDRSSGSDVPLIARQVTEQSNSTGSNTTDLIASANDWTPANVSLMAKPPNRCGVYPKGAIIIRHKIDNGPPNTIINGFFLPNASPHSNSGSFCITIDLTTQDSINIAFFPDQVFKTSRPWRRSVEALKGSYSASIAVNYKSYQGFIREVQIGLFGSWERWNAPEDGQILLFQRRGIGDNANATAELEAGNGNGTTATGSTPSFVEIS